MSKFFFKGTPDLMGDYGKSGYNPKPAVKPGSKAQPLAIRVKDAAKRHEVELLLAEHNLVADIEVDPNNPENLTELESVIKTPDTLRFEAKPSRNEPCVCGSGKKYKKCCG